MPEHTYTHKLSHTQTNMRCIVGAGETLAWYSHVVRTWGGIGPLPVWGGFWGGIGSLPVCGGFFFGGGGSLPLCVCGVGLGLCLCVRDGIGSLPVCEGWDWVSACV